MICLMLGHQWSKGGFWRGRQGYDLCMRCMDERENARPLPDGIDVEPDA